MKKLSLIAILSILALPAYATDDSTDSAAPLAEEEITTTETAASETSTTDANDAADETATPVVTDENVTNPEIKFPHGLQIGVGLSATSGLNGFVGYNNKHFDSFWLKRLGVRFDFATTAPLKSAIKSGIDSIIGDENLELGDELAINDISIKGHHFAALVDFYPFGDTWFLGGIRISGGYYFGNLNASAKLTGTADWMPDSELAFELNGVNYRYTGNTINAGAEVDWDYNGPYLGAGFDLGLFAGLKIYFDAGVVFANRAAQLGLDVPLDGLQVFKNGTWVPVANDMLVNELEQVKAETLADAQDELNKFKFYPMVKIGFMYRF